MAYDQAIRTGESGYTTISEFGKSLKPPAPQSEIGVPLATAFGIACVSMILLPGLHMMIPLKWFESLSPFDTPVLVISVVLGLVAGFRSAVSALVHNDSVHRREMRKWERGVVCRRCGFKFRRR